MKCPICKSDTQAIDIYEDHIIVESEIRCDSCQRFKEYFAYGCIETGIKLDAGWKTWQWCYDIDLLERNEMDLEIGQVAKEAFSEYAAINRGKRNDHKTCSSLAD